MRKGLGNGRSGRQYKSPGRSGVQVRRLAPDTMNFGMVTDEGASFRIMDEALAADINFIDTADVYVGPQSPDMEKGYGISEEIIGRWNTAAAHI